MATNFNGVADQVAAATPVNIASSTNATPIEITTSTNHGLSDGDLVRITGHTTNYTANGLWIATVVSATKFTIATTYSRTAVAGTAVGGATGTAGNVGVGTYAIPADTDDVDAASVNVAFEALGDRTAYVLAKAYGAAQIGTYGSSVVDDLTFASWANNSFDNTATTEMTNASAFLAVEVDVLPGDIVDVTLQTTASTVTDAAAIALMWFACEHDYGVAASFASSSIVVGSAVRIGASLQIPLHLHAQYTVATATRGKQVRFYLAGRGFVLAAKQLDLEGSHEVVIRVLRPGL
jgi:hypothetical protein